MTEDLAHYDKDDRVITSYEMQEEIASQPPVPCVQSGIKGLDEILNNQEMGELITLSGETGQGKTTFSKTLVKSYSERGIGSLVFTCEDTPRNYLKSFSNELPLFYMPHSLAENKTVKWIEERVWEAKLKFTASTHPCEIVVIDHMQYLVPPDSRSTNSADQIGQVMRELKQMALRLDIIVYLICHTMKIGDDQKPGLWSLRGSSFIAQESDIVLFVYRKKEFGEGGVMILKNRREGVIDKVIPVWRNDSGLFQEVE